MGYLPGMPPWLHSLLPHLPRYGFVLVFIAVFLNNIGIPLPGEAIFLGAGFILGRADLPLWQPMAAGTAACFIGGICAFWFGRRLKQGGLLKIRWLHLTRARVRWAKQFFRRRGARTVFISRFIAILPPAAVNVLAGMTHMPWKPFLLYNFTGSAASTVVYILLGYFFGKSWSRYEAALGPTVLYVILGATAVAILGVLCRHLLARWWKRLRGALR
ncbi:MAG: DedA family protein [Steroidobacteraceae bacterium]|jgi:membrane protein DedA with SNARE-associated domain